MIKLKGYLKATKSQILKKKMLKLKQRKKGESLKTIIIQKYQYIRNISKLVEKDLNDEKRKANKQILTKK